VLMQCLFLAHDEIRRTRNDRKCFTDESSKQKVVSFARRTLCKNTVSWEERRE
jgi:hypothetical protein